MTEILFKVGDSGGYRDGDIIAVKPDGWLISPADMTAYIATGKEPAVLAEMPDYQADAVRRRVLAIRWKQAHTAAEIEAEYKLPKDAGAMEKADADADAAEFGTNGLDTNWGTQDLKSHAVVRVADLTEHERTDILDRDWKNDHTNAMLGKVKHQLPYATVLDAAKVTAIQDKALRVDVDRVSVPLAKAVIVTASRIVPKAVEK